MGMMFTVEALTAVSTRIGSSVCLHMPHCGNDVVRAVSHAPMIGGAQRSQPYPMR